jgi:PTH1 family peptidyl-tRNA hydrolase
MIKLIVGLGNPGWQYEKSRHNAGFLFLDQLALELNITWVRESKFQALVGIGYVEQQKIILVKPETFMNRSGQAVGQVVRYYGLKPDQILVIHDELDVEVGSVRLKKGGGHAGHNGLRDIITHLASKDFYRLRIGIGRPSAIELVAAYVLSSHSPQETELINLLYKRVQCFWVRIITGQISQVMNELHKR